MEQGFQYLKDVYEYDEHQELFTVKVALDTYQDLFNKLDPSPIRRRDISPDLRAFLEDCSSEIPLKYKTRINLVISHESKDALMEREISTSLKNYFSYVLNVDHNHIRIKKLRAFKYMIFSITAIILAVLLRTWLPDAILSSVAIESVTIASWVFLWETISVNFIQMDELSMNQKKYQRLKSGDIIYSYPA
jgi:hypothetical protein